MDLGTDDGKRRTPGHEALPRGQENDLLHTPDARVWARTFLRIVAEGAAIDEGMMLGWFANALMAGWDHHERSVRDKAETAACP
jgi:hypothetical protein